MSTWGKYIITFLLGLFLGALLFSLRPKQVVVETQVIEHIDTIIKNVVEERVVYKNIVRHDTVWMTLVQPNKDSVQPNKDSVQPNKDSTKVVIPIESKVYEDSLYRAVVSGYKASLDSITLYQRERIIYQKEQPSRFVLSAGLQMGAGLTPKGFQPYVGVGISAGIRFGNKRQK